MFLQDMIDNSSDGFVKIPLGFHDIGEVDINRGITLVGSSSTDCRVKGKFNVKTGSQVKFKNFRLTPEKEFDGVGINFENAFNSVIEDMLIENFDIGINVTAGVMYTLNHNYIVGNNRGLVIRNKREADEGDMTLTNNCFSGNKITGVHYISSGGMRCIGNKFLFGMYGFLGEWEGISSDLIFMGNSIENQTMISVAFRVNKEVDRYASFENVQIIGNQFATNCQGIWVNKVNRVIVQSNIMNTGLYNQIAITECTKVIEKDNI